MAIGEVNLSSIMAALAVMQEEADKLCTLASVMEILDALELHTSAMLANLGKNI